MFFLHDAVPEAVGGEAAFGLAAVFFLVLTQFVPGLPALSQRLHEQGQRGQQVAEARQVEGAVVGLGVVVQEPCESQGFQSSGPFLHHVLDVTPTEGIYSQFREVEIYVTFVWKPSRKGLKEP